MSDGDDELLEAYTSQLRARIPPVPRPLGAVFEQDGLIVRAHYGTHGTAEHRGPLGPAPEGLIRRQQEAFAARSEPVEWRVHADDPPELARQLVAAGFTPGWGRSVLVARVDAFSPDPVDLPVGQRVTTAAPEGRAGELATASGPHRTPLAESVADGDYGGWHRNVSVVEVYGRAESAGWAVLVNGTEFVSIGGMTAPEPAFFPAWVAWIAERSREPMMRRPPSGDRWRYFVAEADGDLRYMLLGTGFREITSVRSFHWSPPGRPAAERPVVLVIGDPVADAVWERFASTWSFSATAGTGPVEPPDSVTWHLGGIDGNDAAVAELERIVQRGLRAAIRPGERVYALHPHVQGYHYDPSRTGGPGQPPTPSHAYPDRGDHRLHTTADLRAGTFGDPDDESLCVFGEEMLREVEADLTALLGLVLRRGGRPAGNVWSFGPDGRTVIRP